MRITAELARRHPSRLSVVEHNAHMYDFLNIVSVEPRGVGRISMNRSGGAMAPGWTPRPPRVRGSRSSPGCWAVLVELGAAGLWASGRTAQVAPQPI